MKEWLKIFCVYVAAYLLVLAPTPLFGQNPILGGNARVGGRATFGGGTSGGGGGSAPPAIKSCNGSNFGSTTQTCVFGSSVAATSVIYVRGLVTAVTTLSVSGCGASWTTNTAQTGSNTHLEAWGIPTAGACTVTLTSGASGTQSIDAVEYGPSTGGVDNMVNLAVQGSVTGGTPINCPSITTAVANERVICSMVDENVSSHVYTAGTGFAVDFQGTNYGWLFESEAMSSAGSVAPQATYNITANFVTGSIAIKP